VLVKHCKEYIIKYYRDFTWNKWWETTLYLSPRLKITPIVVRITHLCLLPVKNLNPRFWVKNHINIHFHVLHTTSQGDTHITCANFKHVARFVLSGYTRHIRLCKGYKTQVKTLTFCPWRHAGRVDVCIGSTNQYVFPFFFILHG